MAQALEAGTAILYAGTARQRTLEDAPPVMGEWNWKPVSDEAREAVERAVLASRKAGEELIAGRRIQ